MVHQVERRRLLAAFDVAEVRPVHARTPGEFFEREGRRAPKPPQPLPKDRAKILHATAIVAIWTLGEP